MKHNYKLILLTLLLFSSLILSAHWTTKGPYGGKVKCLHVCDTNVYVGTYDGGVYRSANTLLNAWRYANYTGLTNGSVNALTSIGKKVLAGTPNGVFRSADIGTTWIAMNSGLTNSNVISLVNSGSRLYAGTNGGGIFMSADSAVTWTQVNNGLTNFIVNCLAVDGSTVYAGTNSGGVFVSTDNGTTWNAINNGLSNPSIKTLVVSGNNMFAGTSTGVFVSNVGTINWNLTNTGLSNTVINWLSASGSTVYAATNAGVFSSPNASPMWTAANSGYVDTVSTIAIYNGKMIGGTLKDGLLKSNSIVTFSWAKSNTGFNNLETFAMYNSGNLVIAATNKGMFVSRDLAASYVRANNGLTDSLHVNCLTFAGIKLYVGTTNGGVFVSQDTGRTWTAANNGMGVQNITKIISNNTHLIASGANSIVYSTPLAAVNWGTMSGVGGSQAISSFATDGTNTFMSQLGGGVYVTANNASWTTYTTGLTNMAVTSLAVKGSNVYAGTFGGGVFKSPTAGAAWATANTGLPTMNIVSLCSGGQLIVAGYKGGVYYTFDDGATWAAPNVLLYIPEFADVTNISFTALSTRVFVGLPYNSLYSNATSEFPTGVKETVTIENGFVLGPNPNSGTFKIQLKNYDTKISSVSIIDVTGKEVYMNRSIYGSVTEINFNTTSGIYFVKLSTDKGILTQKMIVE